MNEINIVSWIYLKITQQADGNWGAIDKIRCVLEK